MNRKNHFSALTILSISLMLGCLVFWVHAQTKKPTPKPTPEKKIQVEDAVERRVSENKVVFKSGFEVTKTSDKAGAVSRMITDPKGQPRRVIVADVECQCKLKPGTTIGNCRYNVENLTATCTEHGGCSCKLVLVPKVTQ